MTTMNISLPQGRTRLRNLLLDGAASKPGKPIDRSYFEGLRRRVSKRAGK